MLLRFMQGTRSENATKLIYTLVVFVFTATILYLNFYCNFYIRPISDDFWRDTGPVSLTVYFGNLREWYLLHNGRYANAVISLLPFLYPVVVYRLIIVALQLVFILTLRFVFSRYLNIRNPLMVACSFLAFLIAFDAAYYETFMWFASSGHYMLGFCLFVVLLCLLFDPPAWPSGLRYFLSALIIFVLVGFNEIWMIGVPFTFATLFTDAALRKDRKRMLTLGLLLALSVACFTFSYLSPGNSVRSALFPESRQFVKSVLWSFIGFATESWHLFFGVFSPVAVVFQLLLLFFFLFVRRFAAGDQTLQKLEKNAGLILSVLAGLIMISLFTVKYGMDYRTLGIGRVRNMRLIFLSLFYLQLALTLAARFRESSVSRLVKPGIPTLQLLITCSLVYFMITTWLDVKAAGTGLRGDLSVGKNAFELLYDYKNDRWQKYDAQWAARLETLAASKGADVVLPPLKECPVSLEHKITSYDLRTDTASYFNKGLVIKYQLHSLKVSEE